MFNDLIEYCELFKTNYIHKVYLLGAFVYKTKSNKGTGQFIDFYLKSHGAYYKIKTDIAKYNDKLKENEMKVSVTKLNEFGYFRMPKNVISLNNNEITFPELTYQVYNNKPEIIFETIDIRSPNEFIINTNLFSITKIKNNEYVDIDLSKAKEVSRDEFVNILFKNKEKEEIMKIFIDNDKYQEKCFYREKERR